MARYNKPDQPVQPAAQRHEGYMDTARVCKANLGILNDSLAEDSIPGIFTGAEAGDERLELSAAADGRTLAADPRMQQAGRPGPLPGRRPGRLQRGPEPRRGRQQDGARADLAS